MVLMSGTPWQVQTLGVKTDPPFPISTGRPCLPWPPMTRRVRVVMLGLAVLLVVYFVRKLRGGPVPAFQASQPPEGASGAPWPELQPEPEPQPEPTVVVVTEPTDVVVTEPPMPHEPAPPELASDLPGPVVPTDAAPAPPSPDREPEPMNTRHADRIWVAPAADGSCPLSHPVKAKTASGIYHQPGGVSYDRTRPDRCYASAADADADGLRPAKR